MVVSPDQTAPSSLLPPSPHQESRLQSFEGDPEPPLLAALRSHFPVEIAVSGQKGLQRPSIELHV